VRDDPSVVGLVIRARDGDADAWHDIVERYAPLLWAICRRYDLARADADDVGGSVWLRLVEHLATLRDPAALPGWIATTTQRECLRVLRRARRHRNLEETVNADTAVDESVSIEQEILAEERNIALRAAFADLPCWCRDLLSLLLADPPLPYAQISNRLGTPIGAIGPNRRRCLDRLRRSPALAALIETHRARAEGGDQRGSAVVER
jgi:RNA polymerase sigma factor (sigma-70 family)